jgi:hypothetical protein
MEVFIPSLILFLTAAIISVAVFPQLTPMILATIAVLALVAAAHNHYSLFGKEYQFMSLTSSAGVAAPYLLVGAVIIGILGYLLFLIGAGKKMNMVAPSSTIPPPETSTNYLTEAIGNGLSASGMANVEKRNNGNNNMNGNTAQRNVVESALSKGV